MKPEDISPYTVQGNDTWEALQASEELNRRILEAVPGGIVHVSIAGAILYANEEAQQLLGLSYNELTSRYVVDFNPLTISEEGHPFPAEEYPVTKCLMTGERQPPATIGVQRPNGQITWAIFTAVPTTNPQTGAQTGAVVTFLDITERKQAEAALKKSEMYLQTILESEPECVKTMAADGTLLHMNPAGLTLLDAETLAELQGASVYKLIAPEHRDAFIALNQKIFQGEPGTLEFELVSLQGRRRWVETHAVPLRNPKGAVIAHLAVTRDITERKQAEVERERFIQELEAKNTELERFTYTVSHDLKSPLVTIKSYLGLLEQDARRQNFEAFDRDLFHLNTAADNMALLLNDLLELSRIGRMINPPETIALSALVREVIDQVAGEARAAGMTITVDDDLPALYGDRLRIAEVFQNLISNGIRFMGTEPSPRIEIGAIAEGNQRRCFVRDNGIGIETPYLNKIFGLFEQLNQDATGTGIGLALAQRIVEVHGGRMWAESDGPGQGTTFWFTLPAPPH